MRSFTKSIPELPFKLEAQLERDIAGDPEWLAGLEWGKPRPGHPEGSVAFHIRDVLNNIDRFYGNATDRSRLRLIALTHDTFKYQAGHKGPGTRRRSHGYLARKFTERYVNDTDILEVIELHDEAYKASLLLSRHGNREAAEKQASELITRLGHNIDLFLRFYLCDSRTGDKSTTHYKWFKRLVEEQAEGGDA